MEQPVSQEIHHTSSEVGNEYACQKIIKSWIKQPEQPSSLVIPSLHRELLKGVTSYQQKGLIPQIPGTYRTTEVTTEGRPSNLFVSSFDVTPVMHQYTTDLDIVLRKEPDVPEKRLEQTFGDAAWAYYTFARIHPFLDGNGRIGRMILKRVLKGRGYKDIIFQTNSAYGKGREAHLAAMNTVHDSGNLAHLEVYLLDQLRESYPDDTETQQQIDTLMRKKQEDITMQTTRQDLTAIWEGFRGLHLDGVAQPVIAASGTSSFEK